jgi:chromosome segregation ATPase
VSHLQGMYESEKEKNERLLRENEELRKSLVSSMHLEKQGNLEVLQSELADVSKQLTEERLVTAQLESLRESLKHKELLQDEKITALTFQLEETIAEKDNIENECRGMRFIVGGERRLRQQAQELQDVLEKNYEALSSEHNSLKFGFGSQQDEIKKLQHNTHERPGSTHNTNHIPSPSPSFAGLSEDSSACDKLLAVGSCE